MRTPILLASIVTVGFATACANASGYGSGESGEAGHGGPGGDYRLVSDLVALPDFIPGMGRLYVQPETLPAGPFIAHDHDGDHVSTIYMIPLDDMNAGKNWRALEARGRAVRTVDVAYNPGHPGVAEPHYHVTLWHVARSEVDLD
ncbi:MAG: hypothetical protein U5K33_04485 [Halofilum sp. (in: g-proteobacteria)]|nr:hypothetical protein [Halofilum sp. (in: g-proteobacteria)]